MRPIRALCFLLLTLSSPALAVPGATDRVPAATLLMPFFETAVDSATHSGNTLLVVENTLSEAVLFHFHVWDIDGRATALQGNVELAALASWDVSMGDLLRSASPEAQAQLAQGPFYRGFVTIDVVTAPTALNPRALGYPFGSSNALQGFIYYTRLSQGSANGLAMVPIEEAQGAASSLTGFYGRGEDTRERIDPAARSCAQQLVSQPETDGCSTANDDHDVDAINLRIFRSATLNGSSRAIVFTWLLGRSKGPSTICDVASCDSFYAFRQLDGDANLVQDAVIRLDHVVNVIEDSHISGDRGGWISIFDVPNIDQVQVYAFSFNAGNPSGNPNLTWDAIFEGYIVP